MGVRDSTVYQTIGEVRAAIANREVVAGLDPSVMPAPGDYAKWTTNRRGYSTQFLVVTRDKATGLIGTTVSSYTTRDQHSIDVALQVKMGDWQTLTDEGGEYEDQQLLGMIPYNIFEMGPAE